MVEITDEIVDSLTPRLHLLGISEIPKNITAVAVNGLDSNRAYLTQSLTTKKIAKLSYDAKRQSWIIHDGANICRNDEYIYSGRVWIVTHIMDSALAKMAGTQV